jgi:hypothetical protein
MKATTLAAIAALLAGSAQPCFAADAFRSFGNVEHRSSAFAGARFRVPLGGGGERRSPTARLHLGVDHVYSDRHSAAPAVTYRTSTLELGVSRRGAPALFVGGAPAREIERRLGISTGGAIAIGAGLMLVILVAAAAAAGPPDEITP